LMEFIGAQVECFFEQMIGFADELHVAILDAVVDHLYVMTGAVFSYPIAAWRSIGNLGRDRLKDLLDMGPGGWASAGHDRRAMTRSFLAARNSCSNKQESLLLERLGPAIGVRVERVAAVDDDIPLFQVRHQGI